MNAGRQQPEPIDSLELADPRVRLANERTFLAWTRTALGFVAAGIAISYLAPADEVKTRALSIVFTSAGALLAVGGHWRWKENNDRLSRGLTLKPGRLPALITAFIVLAAVFAGVLALTGPSGR